MRGEAEAAAEFDAENAKDTKRQADAGIQTIKFDGAGSRSLSGESLSGGLGRHHQAKPRARSEDQGILLQEIAACRPDELQAWRDCPSGMGACSMRSSSRRVFCCCVMTVMIGADVVSRNIGGGGVAVSNELSEDILYLMTLLAAPWLLRQGQHIRVDIILRALPVRVAWVLEWVGDIIGLLCCLYFVWYGVLITVASYKAGSINIKTLVTPEWWTLAPLPIGFALLGIEFIFRMYRLSDDRNRPA